MTSWSSAASFSASSAVNADFAGGGARRGAKPDRDLLLGRIGIERGMQQLVERRRLDAGDGDASCRSGLRRTMSTAAFSAASAVRLPERVCSMKSLPSCTVNSTSCMSR